VLGANVIPRVYVAGSSDEIERAERNIAVLRALSTPAHPIEVVSTWPSLIKAVGAANPADASTADRKAWSLADVAELERATILWLLAPTVGAGRGAYFELGYALALGMTIIASGPTTQSIFPSLGMEFQTDQQAQTFIAFCAGLRV